jgi:hypothetical protein
MLRWDTVQYDSAARMLDVKDIGRYLVRRRSKGSRQYVALLNGKSTTFCGSRDEVETMVERSVRATVGVETQFQRVP